ncbi:N-(5'-phosphoribosyl)anthranilate isomerase [Polaribacter pacificus]|uniref:N-(5'-phosphoribosyl)anthranilate isomerase n=2 Tax=Polaribacter pacificus TaxID=1775173 RepID=A0A917HV56_9FLAO|nr:N-(5'-phosphoribosyl)anthranilate isomerase [Polaribacter pacificus]
MKYLENIQEVASLQPDYLGFIFYEKSKRYFDAAIPKLPKSIRKVGVFVNAQIDELLHKIQHYNLQAIQLHGDESVAYLQELKQQLAAKKLSLEIIKVFSVLETFDFDQLTAYEPLVDYFLFDTKGNERGGNGVQFDWSVLNQYNSLKPFFLSGGIGPADTMAIKNIIKTQLPIYAVDVNSKFELAAGLKNTKQLKAFKEQL